MIITQKTMDDIPQMKTYSQIKLEVLWQAIEDSLNPILIERIKTRHKELMEDYDNARGA